MGAQNGGVTASGSVTYRFGDWLVDASRNRVERSGEERGMTPKAMDVLVCLIESSCRVVPTDALLDRLWAGRCVESSIVHRKINQIRCVLGDDPRRPRYIETIPRRGYRAIAPVTDNAVRSAAHSAHRGARVALLPFEVLEEGRELKAFVAELYDDFVAHLSKALPLSVIVTSADAYGSARVEDEAHAPACARLALYTRVRRRGHTVRLWLTLLTVESRTVLHADAYEATLDSGGAFAAQDALASNMSRAVIGAIDANESQTGIR